MPFPLPTAPRSGDTGGRWTVARQVGQFALAGVMAAILVGLATAVASRRIGEREAIVDARTTAILRAQSVVEPVVTDGLLTAEPAAVDRISTAVETGVLDRELVRVKIWTREGKIVYSDEPRLAGATYDLGIDETRALDDGRVQAEISDLSRPENRFERDRGKLLEVYLPIRTPNGSRLLFEAYFRYGRVSAAGNRIWRSFAPTTLGALVVLELVQVPIAWSLARRLRARQREREVLLSQAIDASDLERRRIAADLHDGVVQDLAGVALTLAGAARQPGITGPTAEGLENAAARVRGGIKSLRSLLVEIYPPNLADEGLAAALIDLVARAENREVTANLDTDRLHEPLPVAVAGLLYRVAQEALRNVVAHAGASTVDVRVENQHNLAVLEVTDDGVGFDLDAAPTLADDGHFGLLGLKDLVASAGGLLRVDSAPGRGTTVHVEIPLR